ncbi:DNA polymerase {pol2} [Geoglobus ahangari]|uniref:DNA polymerase n=1 Tax=Geoglobus ahangari TaxID=113653 RepID=A0A0F7IGS1_9EURY|nr:DNA-directed DNA polymerase [Geoglobus ahangari]AKG91119.1 DNA polymerase {pol2} [Geoglobus ahangari]
MEGWLIDADYVTENDRAVVRLWCKDDEGVFIVYDRNFTPYFYVIPYEDFDPMRVEVEARNRIITPQSAEVVEKKVFGKVISVYKIYAKHPQDVPKLREEFKKYGDVREADIPFAYRYLIDRDLACMDGIRVEGKVRLERGIRVVEAESVERVRKAGFPELKVLAFDCEMLSEFGMADPEKDPVIIIGVKMGDYEEIIHGEEREIISRFVKVIRELDPDIIVGYNQDGFDWPYLRKRAEKLSVRLAVGRDGSELTFRGGRPKMTGRLNVDLYDIAMRLDVKVKKLENVAEFLGRKVEIADIEAKDIYRKWVSGDKESVFRYSRQDILNTYFIAEELLPMHYELSKMIRVPVDDITRMGRGRQVDWLLLSEAYRLNELAPNPKEVEESYEGAFVLEPKRGLHENVYCLDFASMYPSIMIAYNISPDTYVAGKCEDCFVSPEVGHKFRKKPDGFFKRILLDLIGRRREVKQRMKEVDRESLEYRLLDIKQQTLKVLTNSFYGYTGWSGARWYCRQCAEATTAWGRHFIKKSAEIARSMGFEVLYGDTDSIFVRKDAPPEQLEREVEELIERITRELPVTIEVDEVYRSIFFVEKKRYAGLTSDGRVIVKGLEVRRGDWCELAKEVQREVIEIILRDKDPEKALRFVREVIANIKSGKYDLEKFVIYKGLTKKPSKYESMQAHVKAALKAREFGFVYPVGTKVGYVILEGSGNIGDRAYPLELIEGFDGEFVEIKTKHGTEKRRLDRDYYINNQVIPSVLRILERFGYNELSIKGNTQKTLDAFFG